MKQIQGLGHPIITGKPGAAPKNSSSETSFQQLLQRSLQTQTQAQEITLSKHAQARTVQRGIELDHQQMVRLEQAVELAQEKGLRDALVMMDSNAFIVNVPNRVIVTVVGQGESENAVFTNIDGAVII